MRRPVSSSVRLATILIVAFALLGSKVSVALAALAGTAHAVTLCTGTGLVRVVVSADGGVVDGPAAASHADARHCDLVAPPGGDVEHRWASIGRVRTVDVTPSSALAHAVAVRSRAPHDPPPRGPPFPGR